jgi:hypothetical protein
MQRWNRALLFRAAGGLLTAFKAARRNKGYVAMSLAGALVGLLKASDLGAQPGCVYHLAVYCSGNIYCTTSSGSNCITCPK